AVVAGPALAAELGGGHPGRVRAGQGEVEEERPARRLPADEPDGPLGQPRQAALVRERRGDGPGPPEAVAAPAAHLAGRDPAGRRLGDGFVLDEDVRWHVE